MYRTYIDLLTDSDFSDDAGALVQHSIESSILDRYICMFMYQL